MTAAVLAGVIILLVVILLYYEYKEHDCMRGKNCTHRRPEITSSDSPADSIEKILEMVQSNNSLVFWRQALLLAVILPVPLIYLIYSRFPTALEWGFVGLFIFLAVYLSYSWIWSHYFNPNSLTITSNLQVLLDRVTSLSTPTGPADPMEDQEESVDEFLKEDRYISRSFKRNIERVK